jgi:hypothetical protein
MTEFSIRKPLAIVALTAAATFGLAACASPAPDPEPTKTSTPTESAIGGDVVAPIELNYQDINGQTIDLVVGQVININYGGVNDGEITVDIADPKVVEYTAAKMENGVQYSAGLTALAGGESKVTFKFNGGDDKALTVAVLLAQ